MVIVYLSVMLQFFAHEGEVHTDTPVNFFDTVEGILFINLAPFVLLALVIVIMRRVLRLKQNVQLVVGLVYLLLVGLLGYKIMPLASIVSLVAGFGLCLALVILPLKR